MQGASESTLKERIGPRQPREGGEVELRVRRARPQHLHQVPEQAEPGDVGARGGAAVAEDAGRRRIGVEHGCNGGTHHFGRCLGPHVGGEDDARAERLGEEEPVAVRGPALEEGGVAEAVHGEAERALRTLRGMPADERRAGFGEGLGHPAQEVEEVLLDLVGGREREGDHGLRGAGLRPHREEVAQAVVGRDPPEEPGVVDEGAEVVDGLDEELVGGDPEHGRIVPAVEPDEHVGVRDGREAPENPVQHHT